MPAERMFMIDNTTMAGKNWHRSERTPPEQYQ
jgi:hypothetical protein